MRTHSFTALQHKIICEFSANQFYEEMGLFTNQITAKEMEIKAIKLKTLWPNHDPLMPFVFCDLVGTEKIADAQFIDKIRVGQESLYNPEEANKIVRIINY